MTHNCDASLTFCNNVQHSSLSREAENLAAFAPDPIIAIGLRIFGTVCPGRRSREGCRTLMDAIACMYRNRWLKRK